ncbi:MAG: hypothetical protein AOA65_0222 [Candidatus Bathyarchaeota archaeon BA1]|nr:MAG: hypothetical protein AOA65_0222 [Candidatus Bathyarchaeota archaeon BA1]
MEMELIIGFFLALLAANTPIYILLYKMSRELGRVTGKTEVLQKKCPLLREEK